MLERDEQGWPSSGLTLQPFLSEWQTPGYSQFLQVEMYKPSEPVPPLNSREEGFAGAAVAGGLMFSVKLLTSTKTVVRPVSYGNLFNLVVAGLGKKYLLPAVR